jgi:hypothetical protein
MLENIIISASVCQLSGMVNFPVRDHGGESSFGELWCFAERVLVGLEMP